MGYCCFLVKILALSVPISKIMFVREDKATKTPFSQKNIANPTYSGNN